MDYAQLKTAIERFRQDTLHDYSSDKAEAVLDSAEAFYQDVKSLYQEMVDASGRI